MRLILSLIIALSALPVSAHAEDSVNSVISGIRTGWNGDYFAIVTRDPIKNPANCITPDGYLADSADPGYKTYYAAALTAYSIDSKMTVIIDSTSCSLNRPKLIGINIYK